MSSWPTVGYPELIAHGFSDRVVPPDGTGSSQILVLGEAPGYHEDHDLIPFHPQADAGSVLARVLRRAGISREVLKLTNVVWSRPPENELAGMPYEQLAIDLWRPHNQALIEAMRPKVIVLLGNTALKTFTEYGRTDSTSITHLQGYALPSENGVILLPGLHPSFILHGQQAFTAALIWAFQRARQLVREGITPHPTRYVEYPTLDDLLAFERGFNPDQHILSYDIETPDSAKLTEEEVEDKDEDISYQIIRMSMCYDAASGYSISFPWQPPFIDVAKRILATHGPKRTWNGNSFDNPRLRYHNCEINGRHFDLIDCFHFIQPTLPRSLEFATPLLGWQNGPWKFKSVSDPTYYSCVDAHATQFNGDALERTLRAQNRWDVYERHVVQVYEVLTQMSRNGLPYDKEEAAKFQVKLEAMKKERESALQTLVPDALKYGKQKLGYKKVPKEIVAALADAPELDKFSRTEDEENDDGLMEQVEIKYEKRPFTIARADATKAELAAIPDGEGEIVVHRWVRIKPFLPTSWQQLLKLIKFYGQSPGVNRKTKKETTDDETLRKLIKKCSQSRKPEEKEFAEVLKMCRECRQLGKVLGTYVKGYVPGRDNKIHSTPGFWGKMMRISWRRPNISATIADKQEEYIAKGFRRCIASESGKLLVEADWRAIEARLVAYFAGDKDYDRLARLGVHDYLACHILAERKKLSKSSIPNVNAPDSELKAIFKEVKSKFPKDRDDAKHIVHGTNYGMTPFLMAEMYEMPLAEAKRLQAIYFQLFPKIILWQNNVIDRADREGKLTNPYSYQMPFWEVRRWNSKYQRWDRGDDAKSAVSFLPRDTAAAMLKEVLLRLRYLADDGRMLCSTHDSILTQVPERDAESMGRLLYTEMTKPVEPLGGLVVDVEVAVGKTWSKDEMEVLDLKALATVG